MNCDLILNENSCRFCLGDAENGTEIFSERKNYFCVQKRLINCDEIFKFLDIKISNEIQAPNIPNRICNQCKTTSCEFYVLKKNFQENEAVLFGNAESSEQSSTESDVRKIFKDYMRDHKSDNLKAFKYPDKLEICSYR